MKYALTRFLVFGLIVLSSFSSLGKFNVKAQPRTITVPDDYSTIQEAINQANDEDTIYVKSGVYIENLIINKTINLKGENKETTIIDVTAGIKIQKDQVTITEFTIYNGYEAISIETNYCNISENIIKESTRGVVVFGNQNIIAKNSFYTIGLSCAIQLNWAKNNLIQKNHITSCTDGIQIKDQSNNNKITENTIENIYSIAIRVSSSSDNEISKNHISNSGWGIAIGQSYGNIIHHNNFINNTKQTSTSEWYAQQWGYSPSITNFSKNYWSNYNGSDNNGDGIGDTPYIMDENNQDNSPLINPVKINTYTYDPLITPDPAPTPNLSIPPSVTLPPPLEPTPTPTLEPEFPTTTVIALAVIVLIGFGVFVYSVKKRIRK